MTDLAIFAALYGGGIAGLLLMSPVIARDYQVEAREMRMAVLHAGIAFPLVLAAVWAMLTLVTA